MRNVVKGFQFSGMAVPKVHATKINSSFTSFHGTKAPKMPSGKLVRSYKRPAIPNARRPGKNVAIKDGYKV